MMKIGSVSAR